MADLLMDFEWPRAPRYGFERYEQEDYRPRFPGSGHFGVIYAKGPAKLFKPTPRILDGVIERLLEIARIGPPADYNEIATHEELVGRHLRAKVPVMAQALGMLQRESGPGDIEGIGVWYQLALSIAQLLYWDSEREIQKEIVGGDFTVFLIPGRPTPKLALRPRLMFNAVMWHAARSITSGGEVKACETCQELFLTGGGRASKTKRAGARFCSDKCRADYHNAKVRKSGGPR